MDKKEGTKDFIFYDDALLINAYTHIIPLMKEIVKRKLPVRFHLPNGIHIRSITQWIADLMREANFKTYSLSLELLIHICKK